MYHLVSKARAPRLVRKEERKEEEEEEGEGEGEGEGEEIQDQGMFFFLWNQVSFGCLGLLV